MLLRAKHQSKVIPSPATHNMNQTERRGKRKPGLDPTNKVHRASDAAYTRNRRGVPLRQEFQTVNCHSTSGFFCPVHTGSVHPCSKCLAEKHGGNACNLTPREPSYEAVARRAQDAGRETNEWSEPSKPDGSDTMGDDRI